ncbi:bifunctional RNase H/acid phosphatase [Streptomyces sp. NPDC127190]|uniref:bifunctional RNase H/acid phosphatase n=1 Tax=unclassified Streptomyces TaxID=2593676 RepID=UPI003630709B
MREFIVEADGGSRGNPGPAGYGAVVRDAATGQTLAEAAEYLGVATNNVAEYRGLVAGLRAARTLDPTARVHVRMDSKLVVEQMSGRWKIKHPDLKPLATEARSLFPVDRVSYEWIPRAENKHADRLANEAMDAGARGEQWTPSGSTADLAEQRPASAATPAPAEQRPVPGVTPASGEQSAAWAATPALGEQSAAPAATPAPGEPRRTPAVTPASGEQSAAWAATPALGEQSAAPAATPALGEPGRTPAVTPASGEQSAAWAATPALGEQSAARAATPALGEPGRTPAATPAATPAPAEQLPAPAATPAPGWSSAPDLGAPATLVLLRHGETPLTPQKRFSGSGGTDPSLSAAGREQAHRVAEALARRGTVQAVIASPLARTRETAGVVAARLGLEVAVDEGLRETDFGAWEGLTFGEVRERYPDDLNAWLADPEAHPTGGGESFAETATRIAAARDKLVAAHAGRTVLLVTHVTPIKTLVRLALGAPPEALFRMELSAASLSAVAYYADGNASVRLFNDTSHLR